MKKDLIRLNDVASEELQEIFALAKDLKTKQKQGIPHLLLPGKTLAMIFEKPSLRTRVTFETGMIHLGGHAIYLAPQDIRLRERETVQDGARSLTRWVDGVVARTYSHQIVEMLAQYARIPVINGLTDRFHPCQILSDLFTIMEKWEGLRGLKLAYIGDGNNVCNSLIEGAAKVGIHLVVACPKGYEPDREVLAELEGEARRSGATMEVIHDPKAAAKGADILYTDVWASMGQEEERAQRLKTFQGFQVDQALVASAKPDVLVMHCLPAHRGEEITDEVIDGPHSIVFDQAENRLHVQKALLAKLLGGPERRSSPAPNR